MLALHPGKVVGELVAGYVAALREDVIEVAYPVGLCPRKIPVKGANARAIRIIRVRLNARGCVSLRNQHIWNIRAAKLGAVDVSEDRPVVAGRKKKLVGECWRERIRLAQLPFIGRLRAYGIEDRIEKARCCRLVAMINLEVNVHV